MKDRIRYSEAFKLKVMEELRDAKWKSVQEAARAYGIAEMSVYNWMRKLGFEHLKGRLIYVKTRTELDRIVDDLKKEWWGVAHWLHEEEKVPVKRVCSRCGRSTVVYYKDRKARARLANKEDFILLLARRDGIANLCEMKYSANEFVIDKQEDANIANRVAAFRKVVGSKRTIHVTLVTANGLKHNVYWNNVQSEIGLDDLFS